MPIKFLLIRKYRAFIGRKGENAACRWLALHDFDILCRNYRNSRQEIDIVARKDSILHFIEVKTRRLRPGTDVVPATAVDWRKKQNVILAAWGYLRELGHPKIIYQFDIMEVLVDRLNVKSLNFLPDTFSDRRARKRARF